MELTDKGPGVGCHNRDINIIQAVIAKLHKTQRRSKLHRAIVQVANQIFTTPSILNDCSLTYKQ